MSIHFLHSVQGTGIPAEAGYTLDRSSACRKANTERETTINAHSGTFSQFRITCACACIWTVGRTWRVLTEGEGEHAENGVYNVCLCLFNLRTKPG